MEYYHNFIEWDDYENPVQYKEIHKVEEALGIKFPKDFVECVKLHHGGHPKIYGFDFISTFDSKKMGSCLGELLSFSKDETNKLLKSYRNLTIHNTLPKKVVPFARDGGGDYMCFDFRENPENPPVVYWEHEAFPPEKAISYLAPTFTDFLKMLK